MKRIYLYVMVLIVLFLGLTGNSIAEREEASPNNIIVVDGSNYSIVNEDETTVSFIIYDSSTEQYGFYDKKTGYVERPIFDMIYDYFCTDTDAPILIWKDGQYSYYSRTGTGQVTNRWFNVENQDMEYINGYAVASYSDETGYHQMLLNRAGEEVIIGNGYEPAYCVQNNGEVLVVVKDMSSRKKEYGLYNFQSGIILEPTLAYIGRFNNGVAWFSYDGEGYGFINTNGEIVIEPKYCWYDEGDPILEFGCAHVMDSDGSELIINDHNEILLKFE